MTRRTKHQAKTVGGYGYSVRIYARADRGGQLSLSWDRGRQTRALGHADPVRAEAEALAIAGELLAGQRAIADRRVTVADCFARYEDQVSRHKKGSQPEEDRRRIRLWEHVLGRDRLLAAIDTPTLDAFVRARAAGELAVPDLKLRSPVRARTIAADLVFLQAVLNYATELRFPDGAPWLARNPVKGYAAPADRNPRQPVATYDRFLKVRPHCEAIDPQQRFGAFMDLVEGLGWRVSALCAIRVDDVELKAGPGAPHGRIRKRGEHDKQGIDQWVPLTKGLQASLRKLLRRFPALGDQPLFPSPRRKGHSWTRWHARDLLEAAETKAKVPAIAGGDFHPYRRKWATERKHLPDADVMHAGGWRDSRSLKGSYQKSDPKTLLAVVSEPTKLREAK